MLVPFNRSEWRRDLLARPFPEEWAEIIRRNVFLDRLLTEAERAKLRDALRVFIVEKYWEGCRGQAITDEVKVTIAAQACLLVLGFEEYYLDEVKTVLVYPGSVLADLDAEGGQVGVVLGQAMVQGPVLLSWWHACWEGRYLGTQNVVLHEFAHVLGFRFNPHEGVPETDDVRRWRRLLLREFRRLRADVDAGRPTLLDPQGTENLAEFFAIATECFFLQARALRDEHPALYAALADWYKQDPASRREPTDAEWDEIEKGEGEYDEHYVKECTALLRLHPDDAEIYADRAAAYFRLGRHAEAAADYDAVLRLFPDDAEAYAGRGAVHLEWSRLDDAIADCSSALRLDPESADAYETRAAAWAAKGERAKAAADRAAARRLRKE